MFLRRPGATLFWCATVLGALVSTAGAATLLVPGDFPTIQDAMNAAQAGDVVLVADGVYTGPGNKGLFFPGPFGFTVRSENGPENCFIDLEGSGVAFFFVADEPASAIIQGFTVRNGNNSAGGAAFLHHDSDATFVNCIFTGNSSSLGGAIYAENDASATFIDCVIAGNTAAFGGGIYAGDNSDPTFINCTISENIASTDGGGVWVGPVGPGITQFIGCSIVDNTAGGNGGGVFARLGSSAFSNCTIAANTALGFGGGVAAQGPSDVMIRNSILWNNSAPSGSELALLDDPNFGGASLSIDFSDVEGGAGAAVVDPGSTLGFGASNIDADPLFVDLPSGDARLLGDSPAIDAGDPVAMGLPSFDVLGFGHLRLDDGDFDSVEVVDMGAVEFGGLVGAPIVSVGGTIQMTLWGRPSAQFALFVGIPGGPLDLGPIGTVFLTPASLILLASGVLPPGGSATVLSVPAPAFAVGLELGFQSVSLGPGPGQGLHATNLQEITVTM